MPAVQPPYGGVQSFSLLRWDNPYKIENISSSAPGRTNTADKPYKPDNVCNAIANRSQGCFPVLKLRGAQRINYTVKCNTIYSVCQQKTRHILCVIFLSDTALKISEKNMERFAEIFAVRRVSYMKAFFHQSRCTLTNAAAFHSGHTPVPGVIQELQIVCLLRACR